MPLMLNDWSWNSKWGRREVKAWLGGRQWKVFGSKGQSAWMFGIVLELGNQRAWPGDAEGGIWKYSVWNWL